MSRPLSLGKVEVGLYPGEEPGPGRPEPGTPFRMVLLGDFSGRASRGPTEPTSSFAGRRPLAIDRDNLDEVLARLGVELRLPGAGPDARPLATRFAELDDFDPDRLFQRVEGFQELRQLRRRLGNPATFADAAAEVRRWLPASTAPEPGPSPPPRQAPTQEATPPAPENLLEQMLGQATPAALPGASSPNAPDWSGFIQGLVAPHMAAAAEPQQAELEAIVDEVTGGRMRALLHHPDFQALEAAWRALDFLVRRLETDNQLRLYVLDITKAELAADLGAAESLGAAAIYRLLVEPSVATAGGQPWAVLVGNYTFGPARDDVELLGQLGQLARRAGAPFLAAASSGLLGCASLAQTPDPDDWQAPGDAEAWEALRGMPEVRYLGLALPRLLLRLPYGKHTRPAEQFAFEEMPSGSPHDAYLWGNPAVACAYLLAEAFRRQGWGLRPGQAPDLDGLPLHVYREDGESQVLPCAEAILTDRAARAILGKGLMPLLSVRDRDAVRLAAFQSLARPAQPLGGRWDQ